MRRVPLIVAGLLPALCFTLAPARAQEGTPAATPTATCEVAPRVLDDLPSLAGTAAANPPPTLPDGEPVDAETTDALLATLRLARACAEAGDLARLLALYSDDYIAAEVTPAEATPIVPGGAPAETETRPAGTPVPPSEPVIAEARQLPDGRIAALVVTRDREDLVLFRYDDERRLWQIDGVTAKTPEPATPAADQPAAVAAAVTDAAVQQGVDAAEVNVITVEAQEWPDTALGCPKPGEFYAQVITPGYLIVVEAAGQSLEYHGDEQGNVVLCERE